MLENIKKWLVENWKSILLFFEIFLLVSHYKEIYEFVSNATQLSNCINEETVVKPCKELLELSGKLVAIFSIIAVGSIIFSSKKEQAIKLIFVYFSAFSILYTTGIGYTDVEQQKTLLEMNENKFTIEKNKALLKIYQENKNNDEIAPIIKIKTTTLLHDIQSLEFNTRTLIEESKTYLNYKLTGAFAIILLSTIMTLILFLQLEIGRVKIMLVFFVIYLLTYTQI